jgi:peptidoglycan/xylan/chitin deacetylase (PgdA/CDA1 family)
MSNKSGGVAEQPDSWRWPEEKWREIVSKVRAGRSLRPKIWPGGARTAVALSFDSDHETQVLRWGHNSPGRLSAGEYGARVGVPRIRKLLRQYEARATFFVPGVVALLHPEEQRANIAEGHEVGIHSWIHELNSQLTEADERDLQYRAADTLEKITGTRPVGIRTPSWDFSPNTLAITREMGLIYDSSLMADDDPYELMENGQQTGIVELPVEWIRDDAPYLAMDRFGAARPYTPPSGVLEVFKREFDGAYNSGPGGLFLLTMHPHIIGHHSRIQILEELIQYIRGHDDVWFATHVEVAIHVSSKLSMTTS